MLIVQQGAAWPCGRLLGGGKILVLHTEKPSSCYNPFRSVYSWINKLIYHRHRIDTFAITTGDLFNFIPSETGMSDPNHLGRIARRHNILSIE